MHHIIHLTNANKDLHGRWWWHHAISRVLLSMGWSQPVR